MAMGQYQYVLQYLSFPGDWGKTIAVLVLIFLFRFSLTFVSFGFLFFLLLQFSFLRWNSNDFRFFHTSIRKINLFGNIQKFLKRKVASLKWFANFFCWINNIDVNGDLVICSFCSYYKNTPCLRTSLGTNWLTRENVNFLNIFWGET